MNATPALQCGFGQPLGRDTLIDVAEQGCRIVRIDLQDVDNDMTTQLASEVVGCGLQPLCIIRRADQMTLLPSGALVEIGNEPDIAHFGWTREAYLREARACVAIARQTGQRLYIGVVSNLNDRGFDFLRSLPWHEWVGENLCCSVHRYPEGDSPQRAHSGCKSREHEIQKLKDIVGARPLAVTEVGYHDGPTGWSEAQVATNMAWERQLFDAHGFEIVTAFQLNDGPSADKTTEAHFGFRRYGQVGPTAWKPVAAAFFKGAI